MQQPFSLIITLNKKIFAQEIYHIFLDPFPLTKFGYAPFTHRYSKNHEMIDNNKTKLITRDNWKHRVVYNSTEMLLR